MAGSALDVLSACSYSGERVKVLETQEWILRLKWWLRCQKYRQWESAFSQFFFLETNSLFWICSSPKQSSQWHIEWALINYLSNSGWSPNVLTKGFFVSCSKQYWPQLSSTKLNLFIRVLLSHKKEQFKLCIMKVCHFSICLMEFLEHFSDSW